MFASMLLEYPVPSVLAMVTPSINRRVSPRLPPWTDTLAPAVLRMFVPPTSTLLIVTPGIRNAATCGVRPVGIATSSSWSITRCLVALWTSTIGASPLTVTLSASDPTVSSACRVAANEPCSARSWRVTVWKPASENVTL